MPLPLPSTPLDDFRSRASAGLRRVASRAARATLTLRAQYALAAVSFLHAAWTTSLHLRVEAEGFDALAPSYALCAELWWLLGVAHLVGAFATGVPFLLWLHGATALTRRLGGHALRWSPRAAVWSFFIPVLGIVWPYTVMRDLHDVLAPEGAPLPGPVARAGAVGYRDVAMERPMATFVTHVLRGRTGAYRDVVLERPPAEALPPAPVGAWWTTFLLATAVDRIAWVLSANGEEPSSLAAAGGLIAAAHALKFVAALRAVAVVRGVTARLAERHRRLCAAPREVLVRLGITELPR